MKRLILISILALTVATTFGYSQAKNISNRSITSGNSKPGLINITELSAGTGLYSEGRDIFAGRGIWCKFHDIEHPCPILSEQSIPD